MLTDTGQGCPRQSCGPEHGHATSWVSAACGTVELPRSLHRTRPSVSFVDSGGLTLWPASRAVTPRRCAAVQQCRRHAAAAPRCPARVPLGGHSTRGGPGQRKLLRDRSQQGQEGVLPSCSLLAPCALLGSRYRALMAGPHVVYLGCSKGFGRLQCINTCSLAEHTTSHMRLQPESLSCLLSQISPSTCMVAGDCHADGPQHINALAGAC